VRVVRESLAHAAVRSQGHVRRQAVDPLESGRLVKGAVGRHEERREAAAAGGLVIVMIRIMAVAASSATAA